MDESRELKLARSYLEDIERETEVLKRFDRKYWSAAEEKANAMIEGNLARAQEQLDAARAAGADVTELQHMLFFHRGLVELNTARAQAFTASVKEWREKALKSFESASAVFKTPHALYNAAILYEELGRRDEAIRSLIDVESLDPGGLGIEATKGIARLKSAPAKESKEGGCFIATACYGSAEHPDVALFRRFRDTHLRPYRLGRLIARVYAEFSPALARRAERSPRLRTALRGVLEKLAVVTRRWLRANRPA